MKFDDRRDNGERRSLDERLREYPELRARIEELVEIVENKEGDVVKADDAEELVVQEIRRIGQEALQGWAERKHRRLVREFDEREGVSRKEKKRCTGTPGSDR
jgi:hypothetical protein